MQLNVPKDQAIKILRQRIQELSGYNFNSKVWKDRTVLDLKQIFGILGDQWLQVSSITFDTVVTSEQSRILQAGKQSAAGLLNSYIDFIEEYSQAELEAEKNQTETIQQQYYELLQQKSSLVTNYQALKTKHESLLKENEEIKSAAKNAMSENQRLKENTLQLDNVTLKQLWTGVQNLPTKQVIAIISIIVAIIIGAFTIGQMVERTNANNELFDLRTENKDLKADTQKLHKQIVTQQSTIDTQSDSIKSFQSTKPSNK